MNQIVGTNNNKISTWVRIVDSMSYIEITGNYPSLAPISAQTYTEYGLPQFDLYDEEKQTLEAAEKLKKIKNVKKGSRRIWPDFPRQ